MLSLKPFEVIFLGDLAYIQGIKNRKNINIICKAIFLGIFIDCLKFRLNWFIWLFLFVFVQIFLKFTTTLS
ncbi:hypothetical protein SPWS13_3691 [Shewanella putrefaciens]|nr:hypothetical protein SPWS13_3691 [Shewanella putrefaciens]